MSETHFWKIKLQLNLYVSVTEFRYSLSPFYHTRWILEWTE